MKTQEKAKELNSELHLEEIYQIIVVSLPCNGWCLLFFACCLCTKSRLYLFVMFRVITMKQKIRKKHTAAITIIKSYICGTTSECLSSNSIANGNEGDDFLLLLLVFLQFFDLFRDLLKGQR